MKLSKNMILPVLLMSGACSTTPNTHADRRYEFAASEQFAGVAFDEIIAAPAMVKANNSFLIMMR